ncbi:MAG: potassium transporter Kef [Desulfocapsa sp.]|nr:MAG: potassium transporter Kef [Desulfocapsa sp.]
MDATMLLIAFILGFILKQVGLPPLLGFLAAGFVLNTLGIEGGETLQTVADFGVQLLLFSIGLKVRIKNLFRPEIWAVASLHMVLIVIFLGAFVYLLSYTGLSLFTDLSLQVALLIAFALSFSSTVFTVKVLEERGEMNSKHGQIAIGILILQDFFAVLFLTLSSGKVPSPWALCLVGLLVLRKPLIALMNRSGHGELLILLGLLIPIGAATLFNLLGMKPDLGALLIGMLLAGNSKTNELAKAILNFKDLLLVGFFLTIGLSGLPTVTTLLISLLLVLAIPIKTALFYLLLTRLKLRARTATLSSLSLATYSEFGLIIGALGTAKGWISSDWLIIFSLSLSISFVLASPLNNLAFSIYAKLHDFLARFERSERLPDDRIVSIRDVDAVIFGMGRVGAAAYETMKRRCGKRIIGVDSDQDVVRKLQDKGWNIINGDAVDYDFWQRVQIQKGRIKVLMLAMPNFEANIYAAERIRTLGFPGTLAALATFDDQIEALQKAGIDLVFNTHMEAGTNFANQVCSRMGDKPDVNNTGLQ